MESGLCPRYDRDYAGILGQYPTKFTVGGTTVKVREGYDFILPVFSSACVFFEEMGGESEGLVCCLEKSFIK